MEQDSQSIMVTWEKSPLKDKTFIPKFSGTLKSILLQHYLIVFVYRGTGEVIVFDLKEKQWLQVKLDGDTLDLRETSSICLYDNNTIVVFGIDGTGKEDVLSLLSFSRDFNGIQIYHDLTRLQKRLLKSYHSANIFDDQMYLYGGYIGNKVLEGLSMIDLKTLKVTLALASSGNAPGPLFKHSTISKGKKIYFYGGFADINSTIRNNSIYLLEKTRKWAKVMQCPTISSVVQIHENNVYIFGGDKNNPNNYLSIYNTSKNCMYEIARKGDIPPASYDSFSALYENKMFIFGGLSQDMFNGLVSRDLERIYSLNLTFKPVSGFIKEMTMKRALGIEEQNKDLEALQGVQKLLDENKDPDIILKVQGKSIPAHKNILSLRSSYFSSMFSSGMQESHSKEIILSDVSTQAFEALIEYFYKGTLPSEQDVLKELIVYSEKILLKRLRLHCERTLINQITKANALELYELSKISEAEDLREAAVQFMHNHFSYFIEQAVSAKNLTKSLPK